MDRGVGNMCRYLLLPEDISCEGAGIHYPASVRACKAVLWIGLSILVGLGLNRLC